MTNAEKYKTAQERAEAFEKYCNLIFGNSVFRPRRCAELVFAWLELESEEDKPLSCPFCGSSETKVIGINHSKKVLCECCKAEGPVKDSSKDAADVWNIVVKFFMKGKK